MCIRDSYTSDPSAYVAQGYMVVPGDNGYLYPVSYTHLDLWSGIIDLVGYLGEGDTERALEEVLGDAVTQAVP